MSKAKSNVEEEKALQLQTLLERAKIARPSPADEEQMAALTGEFLAGNKAAVATGVEALLQFPWSLAVKAVSDAWPKIKPAGRKQILAALAVQTGDEARRVRLSLARGLVTLDAESAHQILQSVCTAMLPEPESLLTNKDRQGLFNVLIGKGKPWLQHLELAAWSAEAKRALAQCVLQAAPVSATFTQEAVLRWASALGMLEGVSQATAETLVTMLNRWPGKLRRELEKLPAPLPENIASKLKPIVEPAPVRHPEPSEPAAKTPEPPASRPEPRPEQKVVTRTTVINVPRQSAEPRAQSAPAPRAAEFDLPTSLRQIEQYVTRLRKDLREAQSQKEERQSRDSRGRRRNEEPARAAGSSDVDALLRHNAQLEATLTELRERFEDLAQDHEDRASTMTQDDPLAQFKSLLGLKLKDSFAEYAALRGQTPNDVLRQHYGDLLAQVFEVLQTQGVDLGGR